MAEHGSSIGLSAVEIASMVNSGRASALSITQEHLEHIAIINPAFNALIHVDASASLHMATAVDARIASGETLPLSGVPVVVKDNIWVSGWRITTGSKLFSDFIAPEDAQAVARLKAAGAIVIGIGACSEFACKGITETPLYGTTRHPHDVTLTPGGSSGGNATAVAARMSPLAIGTDAGGSSRRPASHCGIVGFKPSQDAIAYGPGFTEPVDGISVIAPMGHSVADVEMLYKILSAQTPPAEQTLQIGYHPSFGIEIAIDEDVLAAFDAAIALLTTERVALRPAHIEWPEGIDETNLVARQYAGLAKSYGAEWKQNASLFDPEIGRQIQMGLNLKENQIRASRQASMEIRKAVDLALTDFDVLIGLTTPCTAWPHDQLAPSLIGGKPAGPRAHAALTPRFNHAGIPAISIPCGRGRDSLPVGLQLVGRRGSDLTILSLARQFENILVRLVK